MNPIILNQITIGDIKLLVLDSMPMQGAGIEAEIGTLAVVQGESGIYQKTGSNHSEWKLSSVDAAQLGLDMAALDDKIDQEISDRQGAISSEQQAREAADQALDGRLDVLETDPVTKQYVDQADSALDSKIDQEISDRQAAVSAEQQARESAISSEQSAREAADSALDGRLDVLETDPVTKTYVDGEVSELQSQITQEISDRQAAVSSEQSAREAADSALDSRLDVLETDPVTKSYVDSAVSAEQSAREGADTALDARLDVLESDPVTKTYVDGQVSDLIDGASLEYNTLKKIETKIEFVLENTDPEALDSLKEIVDAFQEADSDINSVISSLASSASSALAAEQSAREAADSALDGRLDILETDPVTKSYVDSADSALQANINAEQSARESADNALDGRLDVLETDPVTKSYVDSADQALDARLDVLETDPVTKSYVDGAISSEQSAREGADSAEQAAREAADAALDARLDVLESDPVTKTYVDAADSALDARLDVLETDPVTKTYVDAQDSAESNARIAADYAGGAAGVIGVTFSVAGENYSATLANRKFYVAGSNTGSITLPDCSGLKKGTEFFIVNRSGANDSTDVLTIKKNDGTTLTTLKRTLAMKIVQSADNANNFYVDKQASYDVSGAVFNVGGVKIINVSTATAGQDAVNKSYADGQHTSQSINSGNAAGADAGKAPTLANVYSYGQTVKSDAQTYTDSQITGLKGGVSASYDTLKKIEDKIEFVIENTDPQALDSLKEIVTAFESADSDLNNTISSLAASASSALAAEQAAREAADAALDGRLDILETDPVTKTYVDGAISTEQSAREDEDLTFVKLDGSRPMSGDLDMGGNDVKNVGALGLGTSTPSTIFEMVDNNVKHSFRGTSTSTTGAVNAVVASLTPASDTVELVKVMVTGIDGNSKDSVSYERTVRVKNIGGTVSLGIVQSDYTSEDPSLAGSNCTFIVNASDIDVRVTGVNAKTITWKCLMRRMA